MVELENGVQEPEFAVALHWGGWIEKRLLVDEVLGLCDSLHMRIYRSMIAAPVGLVRAILLDEQRAAGVVLHQDSVGVGWTLILLVDEGVLVFLALVSWLEIYLILFVAREDLQSLPLDVQLIVLGD